jgi:type IV pilus assembly protein PilA
MLEESSEAVGTSTALSSGHQGEREADSRKQTLNVPTALMPEGQIEGYTDMRKFLGKSRKGFTLIELMIVVAIIGILAAIAIPNFIRFQLKAKTSEGKVNIAAIRTAEEAFFSEFGTYVPAVAAPASNGGTAKTSFGAPGGFDTVGWAPEGQVYFNYEVVTSTNRTAYVASAGADIDGNGTDQAWGYVHPASGSTDVGVAGGLGDTVCASTGALTASGNVINQVLPCIAIYGQSEF